MNVTLTRFSLIMMLLSSCALFAQKALPPPAKDFQGTALETMNAATYTYVHLDMGTKKIWIAGPKATVKKGDKVTTPGGFLMKNFESPTLKRKFDEIYFVTKILTGDAKPGGKAGAQALPPGHPPIGGANPRTFGAHQGVPAKPGAALDYTGIKKADKSVSEIFAESATLAGKPVKVRGKVVKVTLGVLNRNWIHLRDGTGGPGTNDLTVTTDGTSEIGSTVVAEGTIVLNQDFGLGYKYPVLMEKSALTVE